jgi:GNAT superfamily N-acetyltransferase
MRCLPVRLRRATASDGAALASLYRDIRRWLLARGNRQWRDERFTAGNLRRDIAQTPVLAATIGGRIIGAVYIRWQDRDFWPDRAGSDALYIRRLLVDRRFAGRGVAERLLAAVAAIARRRRRARLRLDCAPLDPLARIYRRLAFTLVDDSELGGYRVFRFERSVQGITPPCGPGRPRSGRAGSSCRPCPRR